jgi:DNA-binding transcriptional LysR family regulator
LRRPLFLREGRGIRPTAASDELAASVAPHLDALEAVAARTRDTVHDRQGTIFVGGPAEFTAELFAPMLAGLMDAGLRFRLRLGLTGELIEALSAGQLDFVIATSRIRSPGIDYARLYREEFVLVGASRWRECIDTAPKLAYAEDLPILRRYWREVFGTEPDFQATLVVPDLRALVAAAMAGAGITALPRYLCTSPLADGRLIVLHEPPVAPGNDILLAWNRFSQRHARNQRTRHYILEKGRNALRLS